MDNNSQDDLKLRLIEMIEQLHEEALILINHNKLRRALFLLITAHENIVNYVRLSNNKNLTKCHREKLKYFDDMLTSILDEAVETLVQKYEQGIPKAIPEMKKLFLETIQKCTKAEMSDDTTRKVETLIDKELENFKNKLITDIKTDFPKIDFYMMGIRSACLYVDAKKDLNYDVMVNMTSSVETVKDFAKNISEQIVLIRNNNIPNIP